MRISDWSSDVCSSDLVQKDAGRTAMADGRTMNGVDRRGLIAAMAGALLPVSGWARTRGGYAALPFDNGERPLVRYPQKRALIGRSEEHTSELQSLMRISYAVFCLQKKKYTKR